ncbi:thioesterase family protein [Phenylobacterium sp. Root700]|uniref:thioesterase family protein n=1 Tax=Phenylobacterium sp. Root700 TaxID=1736591 RepID=UPI000A9108AA|nr:thioesterase family protein [Phenylobacterium sp. Root700]
MTATNDIFSVELPDNWLQGRTAYGGLTAAICLEAAQRSTANLPPLRSAQFALVGPATGALRIQPSVLRRGRSTVFVGVDLTGAAGLAARGALAFGEGRNSVLDHLDVAAPNVAAWDACPELFTSPGRPAASHHFDMRLAGGARPRTPDSDPMMQTWLRHKEAAANACLPGLVALADAPPAAATVLFPHMAPFSTMTWALDMLTDAPASASGWWLAECSAQSVRQGYSTQSMTLWNDLGAPVIAMRQSVAIFI